MRVLASCFTPRTIRLQLRRPDGSETGAGVAVIRPPTTLEAVTILATYEGAATGDVSDLRALRRVADSYLGLRTASYLFALPIRDAIKVLFDLLSFALTGAERTEAEAKTDRLHAKARKVGWHEVFAEYRRCFPGSVPQDEPWPYFVGQWHEVDKMLARDQIRSAAWYAAAKSASVDELLERADWKPPVPEPLPQPDYWTDEYVERQMQNAKRLRARMMGKVPE